MNKNYYLLSKTFSSIFLCGLCAIVAFGACCQTARAQTWNFVGSGWFSAGATGINSIAIDAHGTPYVAFQDSSNDSRATVMKYDGTSWVPVGSPGFTAAGVTIISIALDSAGLPYVVYPDSANAYKATVMKYNGTNWVVLGVPGFSDSYVDETSIVISRDTAFVCFQDASTGFQKATVMKYNGSSWVFVGSPNFSAGPAIYISMAIDASGTPYVVYGDLATSIYSQATVMKYNGSAWVTVGLQGFSVGQADNTTIAIDSTGVPYVAYEDEVSGNKATVMKYVDTSWVTVGSAGFSDGDCIGITLAMNGMIPYVVFSDYSILYHGKVTVMDYNGTSWGYTGSAGFSDTSGLSLSMAIDNTGTPYVAYNEYSHNSEVSVMKFGTVTGVENITRSSITSLTIFPDPNSGSFTLNINSPKQEAATILVSNVLGEKVKELKIMTNNDTHIALDNQPGIYYISAKTEDGTMNSKIVVE